MTNIGDFVLARINEERRKHPERLMGEALDTFEQIVHFHKKWPILVEKPPMFEMSLEDSQESLAYKMTRHISFLTEQEYVKKFGIDPPTAPIMKMIAKHWCTHPDWKNEWEVE